MERVERFIAILGDTESHNYKEAWGDNGFACGRFQEHPSFYASWGPRPGDFGGVERSWHWCFEFAVRRFFAAATFDAPGASDGMIAMAYHLHGQVIWTGFDEDYKRKWDDAENRFLGII
jgi:hypothetical protein